MRKLLHSSKGFTLIELLIVIAIIAILAAVSVAIFNTNNPQQRARDARRVSDVNAVADALEAAFTAGAYPALATTHLSTGTIPVDTGNGTFTYCAAAASVATTAITWAAGSACPTAPAGFALLAAGNPAAGTVWTICAHLEVAVNGSNIYCRAAAQR